MNSRIASPPWLADGLPAASGASGKSSTNGSSCGQRSTHGGADGAGGMVGGYANDGELMVDVDG